MGKDVVFGLGKRKLFDHATTSLRWYRTYDELSQKGIAFEGEPYCNRHTGLGNVLLRDPDGWRLQLCDKVRKAPRKGVNEASVVAKL